MQTKENPQATFDFVTSALRKTTSDQYNAMSSHI